MYNKKLIIEKINKEDILKGKLDQFLGEDSIIVSVIQGGKIKRFCRNFECKNPISPNARRIYCSMSCQYRMQNIRQKKCRPNSELVLQKKKHIERLILMTSRFISVELELEPKIEENDNLIKFRKYISDSEFFLPKRVSRPRKPKHFDDNIVVDDSFSGDDCELDPDYNDQDGFDFKNVKKKKKDDNNTADNIPKINSLHKVAEINIDDYDDESFFDDDFDDKCCIKNNNQEEELNDANNFLSLNNVCVENLLPDTDLGDFKREDYVNEMSQSPKSEVLDDNDDEEYQFPICSYLYDEGIGSQCCLSAEEMKSLLDGDNE